MNPPANENGSTGTWLLIVGLVLGATVLGLMSWESSASRRDLASGSAEVIELTSANWQREVVESDIPVLVDFTAPWCPPCRALAPTIDRLSVRYKGKVKVGKLNVDNAPEIAKKYGAPPIPLVLIFHGSEKPSERFLGPAEEEVYARHLDLILDTKRTRR